MSAIDKAICRINKKLSQTYFRVALTEVRDPQLETKATNFIKQNKTIIIIIKNTRSPVVCKRLWRHDKQNVRSGLNFCPNSDFGFQLCGHHFQYFIQEIANRGYIEFASHINSQGPFHFAYIECCWTHFREEREHTEHDTYIIKMFAISLWIWCVCWGWRNEVFVINIRDKETKSIFGRYKFAQIIYDRLSLSAFA